MIAEHAPESKQQKPAARFGYHSCIAKCLPKWILFSLFGVWFFVTIVLMLIMAAFVMPFYRLRASIPYLWGRMAMPAAYFCFGVTFDVFGLENLGHMPDRPVVYVANHTSTLDFLICTKVCSRGTVSVAKRELLSQPIGWAGWMTGSIFIDRSNKQRSVSAVNALKDRMKEYGSSVLIFPEGTRSPDGKLMRFKKGAMHLSMQAGVDVVPIVISGAHGTWGKNIFHVKTNSDKPIRIDILAGIKTSTWSKESIGEETESLVDLFCRHLPEDQLPADVGSGTDETWSP